MGARSCSSKEQPVLLIAELSRSMGSGASLPGFKPCLTQTRAVWPWMSSLTLRLSFQLMHIKKVLLYSVSLKVLSMETLRTVRHTIGV